MHRVSVARLAREGKISGLVRGANGRFRVSDQEAVLRWIGDKLKAQRYRFRGLQCVKNEDVLKDNFRALAFAKDPSRGAVNEEVVRTLEEERRTLLSGKVAQVETCSTADIARMLGVTVQTVRNRARNNQIPGVVKTGRAFRFDRAKVEAYCADKSHHTKVAPSRRVSNAIERLQRAVTAVEELSRREGLKGYRPSLQRIADQTERLLAAAFRQ
jgi:excisionase family DNA binding protein